jgi:CRP-like cAMP-binding protein
MFKGWPRSRLEKMCHMVKRKSFAAGEIIIHQNSPGDFVYFIIKGRCQVS